MCLPREDKRETRTPSQVTDIPLVVHRIEAIHGHTHILQQKHTIVASRGGCRGTHPTRCKTPVLGRNPTNQPSDPHTRAPPPTPCMRPRTRAPRWVRAMTGHRPPTMVFGCAVHGGDTHVGLLFLVSAEKRCNLFGLVAEGPCLRSGMLNHQFLHCKVLIGKWYIFFFGGAVAAVPICHSSMKNL